jgi:hypothetical protein
MGGLVLRSLALTAIGLASAACKPSEPPRVAPTATLSSKVPAHDSKTPTLRFIDTMDGPFATAVPPQVVSLAGRIHLFAGEAGTPPALRHVALGPSRSDSPDSVVLPAKTIVASAACEGRIVAVASADLNCLVISIDESNRINSTEPFVLPDRPWAALALACESDTVWILGLTTDVDSSEMWAVPVEDGKLGSWSSTTWKEHSSGLSATVIEDNIVLLRTHGDHGGATLIRLREGNVVQSVRLADPTSRSAQITHMGRRLAVVWTTEEAGRQAVRLRPYNREFEPTGPVYELARVGKPQRLGALFAMPGPRSLLAVSFFTSELTGDMVGLPDERTEPAEHIGQYLVVFDADNGATSGALKMSMTGSLGGGGWAGDDLLFVVSRFSSVVARYRVD